MKITTKGGVLLVRCPFSHNYMLDGIRGKRFRKGAGEWVVPLSRANVAALSRFIENFEVSPDAFELMERETQEVSTTPDTLPEYNYKVVPFPHQKDAVKAMYGRECSAFFMDMRTGKTKVAIDMYTMLYEQSRIDRVLVVMPLSIRMNWHDEIISNSYGTVVLMDTRKGIPAPKRWRFGGKLTWLLCGIESLSQGRAFTIAMDFMEAGPAAMIVDESSRIKNHRAARTKACNKLGRQSRYRSILTGTPVLKSVSDLYAQFNFLDRRILGHADYYSFRGEYVIMGGYKNKQEVAFANVDKLMALISPHVYQVKKSDVFKDIPPMVTQTRTVKLNPAQKNAYSGIKKNARIEYNGAMNKVTMILSKILRMHEITCGFVTVDGKKIELPGKNPKVMELMSVLDETDEQVIIWCTYQKEIEIVYNAISTAYGSDSVGVLCGATSEEDRHDLVNNRFRNGDIRYLISSTSLGAMGLEMSAAGVNIYFSNTFNAENKWQSMERTQSIHQKKPVVNIEITAQNTVDELILAALSSKKSVAQFVSESIAHGDGEAKAVIS